MNRVEDDIAMLLFVTFFKKRKRILSVSTKLLWRGPPLIFTLNFKMNIICLRTFQEAIHKYK